MSKNVARLIKNFQPLNYDLEIIPDREAKTFTGSVTISGRKVGRPSKRLTFHQNGLKISQARINHKSKNGTEDIAITRINCHQKLHEVRLHAGLTLYPGAYTVHLEFNGKITRNMSGIYPCFFEHDGQKKELIATQFESHQAREVFPCIDEPEAKATFDLTLYTPVGETVIANTPIKKSSVVGRPSSVNGQTTGHKLQKTTFEQTPKMSTYLMAFVYGELGYNETKTNAGVIVRAYATPDNVKLTDFALDTAVRCLEFYDDYFGVAYPLPKCDIIALPDFAVGAMENWGCITFREQCMLVDPQNTALGTKQYVAMVVAHELAHQWFGNLVTMRWWTDLWLNEGFASWVEYLATDKLFPDWQMWTQFIIDEQQQALKLDALEYTHPIEVAVHSPEEIPTIFDAISYNKGASVIHMLHEYLGADMFRDGMRHYLTKHAYSNTDTVDLWDALEDVSGKSVSDFMNPWTNTAGFPLLQASITRHGISLAQKRFQLNPKASLSSSVWPVPIKANIEIHQEIITTNTMEIKPPTDGMDLQFNYGRSGFYRVSYDKEQLMRLGKLVDKHQINPLDRLGLLSDIFEIAKAGHTETTNALRFLEYFGTEQDYAVWDVIVGSLSAVRLVMGDEVIRESMKPFIRELIQEELERIGWDRIANESHFDRLLRPLILGLAASADEKSVVKHARALFTSIKHPEQLKPDVRDVTSKASIVPQTEIDPDMRGVVFGTVARLGDQATFDKLLRLHNEATLSEERTTLCAALTGFRQEEIIKQALALIKSDTVRLQDVMYWVAYSFMNRHARLLTWEWLKDNWEWLQKNLGEDIGFNRLPIYAARVFTGEKFIQDYQSFFESKMSPTIERSFKQGVEMLQWQTAWLQRDGNSVKTFFANHEAQKASA